MFTSAIGYIVVAIVSIFAANVIQRLSLLDNFNDVYVGNSSKHYIYTQYDLADLYSAAVKRTTKAIYSLECKGRIETEFIKHFRAVAEEIPFPFEDVLYHTQCSAVQFPPLVPVTKNFTSLYFNNSTESFPQRSAVEHKDPQHLSILYVMLIHNNPEFALRIVDALAESQHSFVIHVDSNANDVQRYMLENTSNRSNIHVLKDEYRQRISWGGFSIVNATLNCMHHALNSNITFDFVIDLSGTSYPIKSNSFIRSTLANNMNTVFMDVTSEPSRPESHMFNQFVECDGGLHRIARMPLVRGINMYIGSQWFALPRHVTIWLLTDPLPRDYIQYAQYIIIADENYFGTMFRNSPYCQDAVNRNLLFVLFDRWENERNASTKPRDQSKCLGVDPDHCGRSPITLTTDFKYLLSASRSLFARKFDPSDPHSMGLVDYIDYMRGTHVHLNTDTELDGGQGSVQRVTRWDNNSGGGVNKKTMIKLKTKVPMIDTEWKKVSRNLNRLLNVTIDHMVSPAAHAEDVAKGVVAHSDLCMEYAPKAGGQVGMTPCDAENANQWFTIGRCTSGFEVNIDDDECPSIHPIAIDNNTSFAPEIPVGYSDEDAFCSIMVGDVHDDKCLDISGENPQTKTAVIGYDCTGRWNQLFRPSSLCQIVATQPSIIGRVRGFEQDVDLCLEVLPTNHIATSVCMHSEGGGGGDGDGDDGQSEQSGGIADELKKGGVESDKMKREAKSRQYFEFMPSDGMAFKKYTKKN